MGEKVIFKEEKRSFKAFRNYFIFVCFITLFIGVLVAFDMIRRVGLYCDHCVLDIQNLAWHIPESCNYCDSTNFYISRGIIVFFGYIIVMFFLLILYYIKLANFTTFLADNGAEFYGQSLFKKKINIRKKDIIFIKKDKFSNGIFLVTSYGLVMFPFLTDVDKKINGLKKINIEKYNFKKKNFYWVLWSKIIIILQFFCRLFIELVMLWIIYAIIRFLSSNFLLR